MGDLALTNMGLADKAAAFAFVEKGLLSISYEGPLASNVPLTSALLRPRSDPERSALPKLAASEGPK